MAETMHAPTSIWGHIEQAERAIQTAVSNSDDEQAAQTDLLTAIAHALVALVMVEERQG